MSRSVVFAAFHLVLMGSSLYLSHLSIDMLSIFTFSSILFAAVYATTPLPEHCVFVSVCTPNLAPFSRFCGCLYYYTFSHRTTQMAILLKNESV